MNLGQIIHQLLLENETVIIPGFGAFISNYKSAVINEETQEITPPSKEILFNQKIRNNDGLLVGLVAQTLSVSHFDALKHIEKERENIIYQLDKGEKVTLEETGILSLNEKQEVQFEAFIEDNLLLDSFGLETISIKEEEDNEELPVEPEIDQPITVAPEPEVKPEKVVHTETEPEAEPEENKPETIIEEKPEEINEEPTKETPKEPVLAEETEEKKKRGWLWFLLIFIPIIIAGIFVANNEFYSEEPITETPDIQTENQSTVQEQEVALTDSTKIDSTETVQSDTSFVAEENIEIIPDSQNENEKFFLIGGSFKEEENAQKFIDQFEIEGYEPFHMGKIGNFYFVGFDSYKTEGEAVIAKREFLEKNPESGIWVYEKK